MLLAWMLYLPLDTLVACTTSGVVTIRTTHAAQYRVYFSSTNADRSIDYIDPNHFSNIAALSYSCTNTFGYSIPAINQFH